MTGRITHERFTLERRYDATPAQIFAAWEDVEGRTQWQKPADHLHLVYDADDYSDDLPFWSRLSETPHLIVPYTLDCNDMRFATAQGFHTGDQFYHYLKDSFDTLYHEGQLTPKMMSVGLHCRLVGRPGRLAGLQRFLDYVLSHDKVWLARRIDIANHWIATHPCKRRSQKEF